MEIDAGFNAAMNKKITSIWKPKNENVWKITYKLPSMDDYRSTTIGSGGQASAGPRLDELLSRLSSKKGNVYIPYDALHNEVGLIVRGMSGNLTYVEIGVEAYEIAKNKANLTDFVNEYKTQAGFIRQGMPANKSTMVAGSLQNVIDGDTIKIKVEKTGINAVSLKGEVIEIRFAGIQTAEIPKGSGSHKEANYAFGRLYDIDEQDVVKVAYDARDFVLDYLTKSRYVTVNIDVNEDGSLKKGYYGRYIAIVYATAAMTLEEAFSDDQYITNLNKTLIATESSVEGVPLAILYGTDNEFRTDFSGVKSNDYTKFDTNLWSSVAFASGSKVEAKEAKLTEEEKKQKTQEQVVEEIYSKYRNQMEIVHYTFTGNDNLNYIVNKYNTSKEAIAKENDMTVEQLERMFHPRSVVELEGAVIKIPEMKVNDEGYVVINNVDSQYGASLSPSGSAVDNYIDIPVIGRDDSLGQFAPIDTPDRVRIGDVDFVVPPLSIDISSTANIQKVHTLRSKSSMQTKVGSNRTVITMQLFFHDLDSINGQMIPGVGSDPYYINGLRPLLAQFKKAPFLPIENEYLNEVHDIHSVALVNLTVTTVPGFPHSLSATLTMAKFEHEAYMPHVDFMDSVINYPLFRWYYQQTMQYRSEYRSYLAPITGNLTNDFVFQIADEAELIEKQKNARQLDNVNSLAVFDTQVASGENLWGKYKKDGERYYKVLEQFAKYEKMRMEKRVPSQISSGWTSASGNSSTPASKEYHEIYNGSPDLKAYFHPPELQGVTLKKKPGGDDVGHIVIQLDAPPNRAAFPVEYHIGDNRYAIPVTHPGTYDIIIGNQKKSDVEIKAYKNNYMKLKDKVENAEGQLGMVDWHINDLILTNINVMYENTFSSSQIQLLDSPTLQYLGGQDPYLQLTFHATSKEAVNSLRNLLQESDDYARRYRYGITSGYLGFKNQLAELFGVRTVLLESINISTIPGAVGHYRIEMILCGFDKTQKRTETLEGFAGAGSIKKEDRLVTQDPLKDDSLVFQEHIRTMEVYPDLELPTFAELNEVIPKLKGSGLTQYPSANGGLFVDPDFYIASVDVDGNMWTFRNEIRNARNRSDIVFTDGIDMAYTRPTDKQEEMMRYTDEGKKTLDEMQKKVGQVEFGMPNPEGSPDDSSNLANYAGDIYGAGGSGPLLPTTGSIVAANVTGGMSAGQAWGLYKNIWHIVPTLDVWSRAWGKSSTTEYNLWRANIRNPSPGEVYQEIYKWIDHFWRGQMIDDSKRLHEQSMHQYVYGSIDDWYSCSYNEISRKKGLSGRKQTTGLPQSTFKEFGGVPPRERIANYLKSIFALESGWHQFDPNGSGGLKPKKNKTSSAFGIGQLMLYWHAKSHEEAVRMAWDWKYNMQKAIKYFYDFYMEAKNSSNIEKASRPLDWAVHGYNQGNITQKPLMIGYFTGHFLPKWKKFNASQYASPSSSSDKSIVRVVENTGSELVVVSKGDGNELVKTRKEMIDAMKPYIQGDDTIEDALKKKDEKLVRKRYEDLGGDLKKSYSSTVTGQGLGIGQLRGTEKSTSEIIKEVMKEKNKIVKFLDDPKLFTTEEIAKLWDDKFAELVKRKQGYEKSSNASGNSYLGADVSGLMANHLGSDKNIVEYEELQNELHNRLTMDSDSSPTKIFQESFTDMLDYDQRGRLVRAFPTFQMFIIDEGRWMSNYRLWDNFYGFNAIQSIDVHKSRKIAADTAVVQMTNMYSNLTSRPLSQDYGEWDFNLWENFIMGEPNEELLKARAELVTSMMLKTGARIHLRLGYSSNVANLPTMFNGTITEMDTGDIVTIVAQGDGVELSSVISANPDDESDGGLFAPIPEPRDLLCKLLGGKGNWLKNVLNYVTEGKWFTESPMGIMHFGAPGQVPPGLLTPWNTDYGEVAQNIYSYNGGETFSQWLLNRMPENGPGFVPRFKQSAESRVEMRLYGKTVWDVAHDLAYCLPDYITAVAPFENRSTLFFGKPYYRYAYSYNKSYEKNVQTGEVKVTVTGENRKPFAQYHMYNSYTDIISNRIKASEDGMYTNVIVRYDRKETDLVQADFDIRYDRQKTAVVESPIVSRWDPVSDFYTSEKQAIYYACSTLRDYIKEMYKGKLTVMGDPTVKPYDYCHIADELSTMNGTFQVESVTHHFSHETGFITAITPDVVCTIDDQLMHSQVAWWGSAAIGVGATLTGKIVATKALRKFKMSSKGDRIIGAGKWTGRQMLRYVSMLPRGHESITEFTEALRSYLQAIDDKDDALVKQRLGEMKAARKKMDTAVNGMKAGSGQKLLKGTSTLTGTIVRDLEKSLGTGKTSMTLTADTLKRVKAIRMLTSTNALTFLAMTGIGVAANIVQENYSRSKTYKQAVLISPLQYQGRNFTAGIVGHKGAVVGDKPGKWDNFYMGLGFDGTGEGPSATVGKVMNTLFDGDWLTNVLSVAASTDIVKMVIPQEWEVSEAERDMIFRGSVKMNTTYEDLANNNFQ